MNKPKASIESLLEQVFDDLQKMDDQSEHDRGKQEFVFHMTESIDDLRGLSALLETPGNDRSEASKKIAGLFYHLIPHLNAAGRLLLGRIPDPFKEQEPK